MSRRRSFPFQFGVLAGFTLALLLAVAGPVHALEASPLSMEILVDGIPLAEYAARNSTYVEAIEGREYTLRLRNRTGGRVAVALSVDGMNTIDAKTTSARGASKWILEPYQTLSLDGWQTGTDTARRFFFTTEEKSYGAWMGKTQNLGIVSAAAFRERRREPVPIHRPLGKDKRRSERSGDAPRAAESPSRIDGAQSESKAAPQPPPSQDLAATGIGQKFDHRVRRIRFETESSPAAVMEIRYEYHDALVRLGVVPRSYARWEDPLTRRERARGFEDFDFAPSP
jgi:hypothetical protein